MGLQPVQQTDLRDGRRAAQPDVQAVMDEAFCRFERFGGGGGTDHLETVAGKVDNGLIQ